MDDIRSNMVTVHTLMSQDLIYQGKFNELVLEAYEDPEGETFLRELVRKGDTVAILVIHRGPEGKQGGEEHVILIDQFRCGAKSNLFEIPAGTLEDNETPHDCAMREVKEEIGVEVEELKYLTTFYSSPGWTDEICHLYYTKVNDSQVGIPEPKGNEEKYSSRVFLSKNSVRTNLLHFNCAKTMLALSLWLNGKTL